VASFGRHGTAVPLARMTAAFAAARPGHKTCCIVRPQRRRGLPGAGCPGRAVQLRGVARAVLAVTRRPSCAAVPRPAAWSPPRWQRCPSCSSPGRSALSCGGPPGGAGLGRYGEVTAHVARLQTTMRWPAANEDTFLSVAGAANARS